MTNRLKKIFTETRALESRLAEVFDQAARTVAGPSAAQPLEIVDMAAEEVARHVQPAGRGRYSFPFNRVAITFAAATKDHEAPFNAICAGPPTIEERIVKRLASARCPNADIDVAVDFAVAVEESWARPEFHIVLSRVERAERVVRGTSVRVDLLVTNGTADRGAYTFTALPIAIGRGAEVRDHRQLLLRLNQVAFTETGDDINQSVSRRHARIELDSVTERPRLIDDNSAQGTSIVRNGRGIPVPRGSRGLGLQTDDEIVVGRARMKVRIGN